MKTGSIEHLFSRDLTEKQLRFLVELVDERRVVMIGKFHDTNDQLYKDEVNKCNKLIDLLRI